MPLKRQVARALRRLAHRFDPGFISSIDVEWSRNEQTHVDIQFRHGQRVVGYVDSRERETTH